MKIPDSCMALLFGTPFDYMPNNMDIKELYMAMEATSYVLYCKPRAKRYRLLFLWSLINQHSRKYELIPLYKERYVKG